MGDYSPNSSPYEPEDETIEPLFKDGGTKFKKRSQLRKFADSFIRADREDVSDYVIENYVIPGIQKTISTAVNATLSMFFGLDTKKKTKRSTLDRISYRDYYDDDRDYEPRRYSDRERERERERERRRSVYECDDIIRDSRGDIEELLEAMNDIIRRKGRISIWALYQILGRKTEHTDRNYGWYSMKGAEVTRIGTAWMLKLPKAVPFD